MRIRKKTLSLVFILLFITGLAATALCSSKDVKAESQVPKNTGYKYADIDIKGLSGSAYITVVFSDDDGNQYTDDGKVICAQTYKYGWGGDHQLKESDKSPNKDKVWKSALKAVADDDLTDKQSAVYGSLDFGCVYITRTQTSGAVKLEGDELVRDNYTYHVHLRGVPSENGITSYLSIYDPGRIGSGYIPEKLNITGKSDDNKGVYSNSYTSYVSSGSKGSLSDVSMVRTLAESDKAKAIMRIYAGAQCNYNELTVYFSEQRRQVILNDYDSENTVIKTESQISQSGSGPKSSCKKYDVKTAKLFENTIELNEHEDSGGSNFYWTSGVSDTGVKLKTLPKTNVAGYMFAGYYTSQNGKGTCVYDKNGKLTAEAKNMAGYGWDSIGDFGDSDDGENEDYENRYAWGVKKLGTGKTLSTADIPLYAYWKPITYGLYLSDSSDAEEPVYYNETAFLDNSSQNSGGILSAIPDFGDLQENVPTGYKRTGWINKKTRAKVAANDTNGSYFYTDSSGNYTAYSSAVWDATDGAGNEKYVLGEDLYLIPDDEPISFYFKYHNSSETLPAEPISVTSDFQTAYNYENKYITAAQSSYMQATYQVDFALWNTLAEDDGHSMQVLYNNIYRKKSDYKRDGEYDSQGNVLYSLRMTKTIETQAWSTKDASDSPDIDSYYLNHNGTDKEFISPGTVFDNQTNHVTATDGASLNLYAEWGDCSFKLPQPEVDGYVFSAWYTEPSTLNPNTNKWEPHGTKITADENGYIYIGSKNSTAEHTIHPVNGKIILYPYYIESEYSITYINTGGWSKYEGTEDTKAHTFTTADGTTNYTIRFSQADKSKTASELGFTNNYDITYDANGGKSEKDSEVVAYDFAGWWDSYYSQYHGYAYYPLTYSGTLYNRYKDVYENHRQYMETARSASGLNSSNYHLTPVYLLENRYNFTSYNGLTAQTAWAKYWATNDFADLLLDNSQDTIEFYFDTRNEVTDDRIETVIGTKKGATYTNGSYVRMLSADGGNVNLYAQWKENSTILPNATRAGYVLVGWYTKAEGGEKIGEAGDKYTPLKSIKMYAHWTKAEYEVRLYPNKPSGASTDVCNAYNNKVTGKTIEVKNNAALPVTNEDGSTTNWKWNSAGYYSATFSYDSSYTPDPTLIYKLEGYSMIKADNNGSKSPGWAYDTKAGAPCVFKGKNNLTVTDGDVISLYAVWEANTYTVNIYPDKTDIDVTEIGDNTTQASNHTSNINGNYLCTLKDKNDTGYTLKVGSTTWTWDKDNFCYTATFTYDKTILFKPEDYFKLKGWLSCDGWYTNSYYSFNKNTGEMTHSGKKIAAQDLITDSTGLIKKYAANLTSIAGGEYNLYCHWHPDKYVLRYYWDGRSDDLQDDDEAEGIADQTVYYDYSFTIGAKENDTMYTNYKNYKTGENGTTKDYYASLVGYSILNRDDNAAQENESLRYQESRITNPLTRQYEYATDGAYINIAGLVNAYDSRYNTNLSIN